MAERRMSQFPHIFASLTLLAACSDSDGGRFDPPTTARAGGASSTPGTGGVPGIGAASNVGASSGSGGLPLSLGASGGTQAGAGGGSANAPGVRFEWPETVPAGPCQAGDYEGTYTGTFQNVLPTSGPIKMTLAQSERGEFLEIVDGFMEASFGVVLAVARLPLEGSLECPTKKFIANVPNGELSIVGLPPGPVTVEFDATYDPAASSLSGAYKFVTTIGAGQGTWTARHLP